jgi:superoxide dismutase, Cu-Zn family
VITTTSRGARSTAGAAVAALALVVLAGCSSEPEQIQTSPRGLVSEATLGPATGSGPARTYDPALAPEGATMSSETGAEGGGTKLTVSVKGFVPNRSYAVHAHVNPCGPTGEAAGPHYQNNPDPMATAFRASTDPAYANPQNEMWLDLRTDPTGSGTATTIVPWKISNRGPFSAVVHEGMQTMTAPGVAGTAGGRIACLDLR